MDLSRTAFFSGDSPKCCKEYKKTGCNGECGYIVGYLESELDIETETLR